MTPLALSVSIRSFFGESLDDIVLRFLLLLLLLTLSLLAKSMPTIFSMKAMESFHSLTPLATLEPRLAYGLAVVQFPVFLFLVIGSLFEHRSTAGILARTRPPIGGTPQSHNRASKPRVF